ncbi:MAG: lipocalin-like domain-containing protein [Bacteroidaceae bacterium]|mgnify:FL=1|nr:lipocalin-like domain-containing protein [Bacteroidaceae bacterium]
MRHKTLYILLLFICKTLLISCTLETSGNGDFDGAWRLISINDTLPTQKNLFWNVQGKLLEMADKDKIQQTYFMHFERKDNQLTLKSPHYIEGLTDVPLDDLSLLTVYGVDNIAEPFEIEKLDGSRMILKSSTKRLEFRQF